MIRETSSTTVQHNLTDRLTKFNSSMSNSLSLMMENQLLHWLI